MEQLNRSAVRAFLSVLVPREAPGVVLLAGTGELFVPRTAPIPWDALEEAAGRGHKVLARLAVPTRPQAAAQTACVWAHLPHAWPTLQAAADALMPALPAALVAEEDCITAYWRVHPADSQEASELMAAVASVLGASPGYPEQTCQVPTSGEALWVCSPPVVWTPQALLAAAGCSLAASRQRRNSSPAPRAGEPAAGEEAEPTEEPLWEEASAAVSRADQDRLAAALLSAVVESSQDPEEATRALGVQAVALTGTTPRVLRHGAWFRVRVRRVELALAPDPGGPGGEPHVQAEDLADV